MAAEAKNRSSSANTYPGRRPTTRSCSAYSGRQSMSNPHCQSAASASAKSRPVAAAPGTGAMR
ncbi:Uncharacterised protein [Mycobacteroides abscessus subsp. abscessus]|nr:Uncharacterised protein [Mycobacteroides abscessus subsp. abscessus]